MSKSKKTKIGQWTRVFGPNLDPASIERGRKNTDILNSQLFKESCERAGIEPTRRQASKFRRKMGKAFRHRNSN